MDRQEIDPNETFITQQQGTISGQWVQSQHTYDYKIVNGTVWLWANDVPNPGDHIYCGSETIRDRGFGGASLTFRTKDRDITLLGPWHSNSGAHFGATGIDLREKHLTFGAIALYFEPTGKFMQVRYKNLLHRDTEGVVGPFDRVKKLAQEFANKRGLRVYYYSQSTGGAVQGDCEPE